MRNASRLAFAIALLAVSAPGSAFAQEDPVKLIFGAEREPAPPVRHALNALEAALSPAGRQKAAAFDIGVGRHGVAEAPESLVIRRVPDSTPPRWLVGGSDEIGLAYALLEIAETIRTSPAAADWREKILDARESPFLTTRSITLQLFNEKLEREWYFDEEFWHSYFGMLARNRFNQFTLTFGHQTNYLNPVYPWLLEFSDSDVRVRGLGDAQRAENLRMLGRIAELAGEHGLTFVLGIWSQQPVEKYGRGYLENFPEDGAEARDYCARGLRKLLAACPAIGGVQFRMNIESGIDEAVQRQYFQAQFDAIRAGGRDVKLDLRYKGLKPETIEQALSTDLDVTVSTKFWCEHMGLPFHPAAEDPLYRESRYGYGAMLAKPRDYRVVYRLWTAGTQRLLVWGDPDYARRFAESCRLGGGEGFEIFAPLSNKGFGDTGVPWGIFGNPEDEYFHWEFERYWFYHLCFGRLGYNPETPPAVWKREFAHRFGTAADAVEAACQSASRILTLLTATKLFSASEWRFWPEMSTGGPLEAYLHIQPSDYSQFYAIEPWKENIPGWPAEPWAAEHRGYVEDALADRVEAKWTPIQVAQRLEELADAVGSHSRLAGGRIDPGERELRSTLTDFKILAQLARYHAARTRAATEVAFFRRTRQTQRLGFARDQIERAVKAWERIVELTDGVYHPDLVFGYDAQRAPPIAGAIRAHTGHWKDRLPEVHADVEWVERQQLTVSENEFQALQRYPGEIDRSEVRKPRIDHEPKSEAVPGRDLKIEAAVVVGTAELRGVFLHHRPMDQTQDWQVVPMTKQENGSWKGQIPGEAITSRFDHLYYLEARTKNGGSLWPNWLDETPYIVVSTSAP